MRDPRDQEDLTGGYRLAGSLMAGIPLAVFFYIVSLIVPLLAGLLYVITYFIVCIKRPQLALLILFASAPSTRTCRTAPWYISRWQS